MKKLLVLLFLSSPLYGSQIVNPSAGNGTVNAGTVNQLAYYNVTGSTVSGTTAFSAFSSSGAVNGVLDLKTNKIVNLANGTTSTDAAAFGQIHLLQVPATGSETTGATLSGTSFSNAGASVTITPRNSASTIVIYVTIPVLPSLGTVFGYFGVSGTTTGDLYTTGDTPAVVGGSGLSNTYTTVSYYAFDTPGTVSAQTYQIRGAISGTGTVAVGGAALSGHQTRISAWEVL